MNSELKNGYYARPVRMEDLEPMVEMFCEYTRTQVGKSTESAEQIRVQWESPILNLDTDTVGVFTEDHRPVGYIEFWDNGEPHVRLFEWVAVHPMHWGQGIGRFLLDWGVERARKNVKRAPQNARVALLQVSEDHNREAYHLLTGSGFGHVRNSHIMRIDFNGPPAEPQPIDGIVIRPIQNDDEEREAMRAAMDAFKDHWGHVDEPFDEFYQRRKYFNDHDPRYDPSLWFIALDGDQIAGMSLCYPFLDEDPEQGWVSTLGVCRPWRKRGLGLELLRYSFSEFFRRGKKSVGLGVDASSLTGATRLYERAGMYVKRTLHMYELELRSGVDLTTQSI